MKSWGVLGGVAAALAASAYVLWGPLSERKRRQHGLVPGLLNLGNTCFLNSLLQGLSACPSFVRWLEGFAARGETAERRPLSSTLLRLLKALSGQEAAEEDLLDASGLLEALRTYRWRISSFEEQDAHELFHVITSSLEDERDRQPRVAHLFDVRALEQPEMPQKQIRCRTRGSPRPLPSQWKHPFHGRLTSNMVCKRCKHQSPLRYDTFDSLSLSIPAAIWGHPLTLDHCLRHFISSESVTDVVCDNCTKIQAEGTEPGNVVENQRTTFAKQLKLGKLPQCLCIHLQRLSWSDRGTPLKRDEHVQFGEFLVMDAYRHRFPERRRATPVAGAQVSLGAKTDAEQLAGGKPSFVNGTACPPCVPTSPSAFPYATVANHSSPAYVYRLMAVVVHHGDVRSGHFVTYRRSPPSSKNPPAAAGTQWLWVSDDAVRKAALREVLASSAYLLFYERVRPRDPPQTHGRDLRAEE